MVGKTAKFGVSFLGAIEYCYYAVLPNRSLDRTQVRGELLYYQHVAPGLVDDPKVSNVPGGERLHIEAIARQFCEVAHRNERVEKPVWHQVFSFAPIKGPAGNTVVPGRSTMARIAQDFANAFGLANNPLIVFRHSEKDHDHFHVIASRVDLNGKNSAQSAHNFRRVSQFCRDMEAKYNLAPATPMLSLQPATTTGDDSILPEPHSTTIADVRLRPRSYPTRYSSTADKAALRQAIDRAVAGSSNLNDFCHRLVTDSPYVVRFIPYTDKDGSEREGVSYGLKEDPNQKPIPGYALGRAYVYGNILYRIHTAVYSRSHTSEVNASKNTSDTAERKTDKKTVSVFDGLAPLLPFLGTAAKHEADIEGDVARINRSLNQLTQQPGKADKASIESVLPKRQPRRSKRRKGL